MGWVSAALYAASALLGGVYYVFIDFQGADRSTPLTFMFPNNSAVLLFTVTVALAASATLFAFLAHRATKKAEEAVTAPLRAAPAAVQAPAPRREKPLVQRGQFYDLCDGMQIDKRIDTRRPVRWRGGKQVGWFDPTSYNGWRVSDEHGAHVGEAADIPSAVAMLKAHLAKQ